MVALKGEGFANEVFEFVQSWYGVCFAFRCDLVGNASFLTARYAVSTECFLIENADFHCYVVKVKATTPSARRSWIWSWTVSASSPTTARASRASWCSTPVVEARVRVSAACFWSASRWTTARSRRSRSPCGLARRSPRRALSRTFFHGYPPAYGIMRRYKLIKQFKLDFEEYSSSSR